MFDQNKVINQAIRNATVKIIVDDDFRGTGFFISTEGWILTAYHCVVPPTNKIPNKIVLETPFDEYIPATLDVNKSLKGNRYDLAILKTNQTSEHCLPLSIASEDIVGDEVLVIGHAAGHMNENREAGIYTGEVSRWVGDINRIELSDTIKGAGHSGSAVYHYKTNRVIAVTTQKFKEEILVDVGRAVPLKGLFENWPQFEILSAEVAVEWDDLTSFITKQNNTVEVSPEIRAAKAENIILTGRKNDDTLGDTIVKPRLENIEVLGNVEITGKKNTYRK